MPFVAKMSIANQRKCECQQVSRHAFRGVAATFVDTVKDRSVFSLLMVLGSQRCIANDHRVGYRKVC